MTPSRLRWGLLFITVGVMFLLNNAGRLDWDYWLELLSWWPLLLIAIGLEKIFLKTKLQVISYLAPIVLVAGMVYVAVDTGGRSYRRDFFTTYSWSTEPDQAIEKIDAVIDHGGSDLYISRTGFDLASARFDRFSRKPDIDFSKSGSVAKLEITRRGRIYSGIVIGGHRHSRDWRLSFSDDVPLKLKCIGDESEVSLNLESVPLESLILQNDDGDVYLKIGDRVALVNVEIDGYDADFRLKIPDGCGIKVQGDKYMSYLKTLNLEERAGNYVTAGFDSAATKVSLKLSDDLRHLSIKHY
ncbi:MAG: hypothetical protein JSU69_04975 [Candidatus Zixiibacteriota bacterium]|nr:MAG: hypothetical protein JSU69_04975 [candidate division Zixibacteria bacterium]